MIFVLLSWAYISFLIFAPGYALIEGIKRAIRSKDSFTLPLPLVLINGLMVAAIIAIFFSLLNKVGAGAHFFLILVSVCCYFSFRDRIRISFSHYLTVSRNLPWFIWVLFAIFVLIHAYAAYLPSSHNDDGLYYSTSIKWVQEFGTIPGLANLNPRIGFNSSWLILQAIFGFTFLHAGLFNDINGLLFIYVFLIFLDGLNRFWQGDHSLFSYLRVLFFLPILFLNNSANTDWVFFNMSFFSSPSPDIPACLLIWLILLLFVQPQNPSTDRRRVNQCLIMLYGTWLLTIKLSVVAIIILMIYILISWLHQRAWKILTLASFCMLLIFIPWCTRTLLVTGYPLFPLPSVDFFSFDWKMPLHHVIWHKNAVKVFAIDPSIDLNKPFDLPVAAWFPGWFARLPFMQELLMVLIGVGFIGFLVVPLTGLLRKGIPYLYLNRLWLVAGFSCLCGIVFWLLNGPDMRLGLGFCLFFVALSISWICWRFLRDLQVLISRVFYALLTGLVIFHYGSFLNGIVNHFFVKPIVPRVANHIIEERDMGHGVNLHLVEFIDSWNTELPCAPLIEVNSLVPKLRGSTLKQGFKATQ